MAGTGRQINGEYFESCSCDYLCPCIFSNLAARPTKGECIVALAFHIGAGHHGTVPLDDLSFVVVAHTPDRMDQPEWTVGLIVDDKATTEQESAITGIASGAEGGPMAGLAPLIKTFKGVVRAPIRFEREGLRRAVSVPGILDEAIEGVRSPIQPDQPLCLDNTMHPANARVALARAIRSHLHAFGLNWDDTSGTNNGHFAPFTWASA